MVTQQPTTLPRVLFVDDQPAWHNVMKRYMHQHPLEWIADFANSGQEALGMLRKNNYAALVTDWKMPGMNGDELVNLVRNDFPQIAQIVQSTHDLGTFDLNSGDRSIQFFPKGGELADLVSLVNQGIEFKKMFSNDSFHHFLKFIQTYPNLPEMTIRIKQEHVKETQEQVSVAYVDCPKLGLDFRILRS